MSQAKSAEVVELFPEIEEIEDPELRNKVTAAWVQAWDQGGYDDLREVPGLPMFEWTDNVEHTRLVTRFAKVIAETINANRDTDHHVNVDYCVAGAICHDLGKPFEYLDVEGGEWINGTWETEDPSIRHPVYSVHIALDNDFPLEVIHAIGSHSREGEHVKKSAEAFVVSMADSLYWRTLIPSRY